MRQQRRCPGIIQRDGPVLVVVWEYVHKGYWCVDDPATVDGVDNLLTCEGADKDLAFRDDGELQRGEFSLVAIVSLDGPLRMAMFLFNLGRGALERIKPVDEYVSQEKEPKPPFVVFIEASQDAGSDELTQRGTSSADCLLSRTRLFPQKLDPICQQAVDCSAQYSIRQDGPSSTS